MNKQLFVWIFIFISLIKYTTSEIYEYSNRLSKAFRPIHYELTLSPDIDQKFFSGSVKITFSASDTAEERELKQIELNTRGLTIDDYDTYIQVNATGERVDIGAIVMQPEYEKVLIPSTKGFQSNLIYLLHIAFKGNIRTPEEGEGGLILSSYKFKNGTESQYLIGNFFPLFARNLFPCFDEPYFKATFSLTVSHPVGYQVLTNAKKSYAQSGLNTFGQEIVWDVFEKTPLMAPSSLGLLVSQLLPYVNQTARLTIWAPTEEDLNYISEINYWESLFKLSEIITYSEFPFEYINFVFIPDLFQDAIESFGVIYMRANRLLNPSNITLDINQNILSTVKSTQRFEIQLARQVATQYYGDIVSPEWWDEVWLRDGISEYIGNFLASRFERKWEFTDYMSGYYQPRILEQNGKADAPPVIEKSSNKSLVQVLKSITPQKSQKGGAILYMLMNALGRIITDPALVNFLKNGTFGIGTTKILSDLLQEELDKQQQTLMDDVTIYDILNSWLYTGGVPLLEVARCPQEGGYSTIRITQRKYTSINELYPSLDWYIPITYNTLSTGNSGDTQTYLWFGEKTVNGSNSDLILNDTVKDDEWIIFNNRATGLYRILYDEINLQLINKQLKQNHSYIDPLNRAQIIDDSFSLASNGYIDYNVALTLSEYLENEIEFYPLNAGFKALNKLKIILSEKQDILLKFTVFIKKIVSNLYETVGFYGGDYDSFEETLTRREVLNWACDYNVGDFIENATSVMTSILTGSLQRPISHDYLEAIFCGGIQNADITIWQKVYDLYKIKRNIDGEKFLLHALACSKDTKIIEDYLNLIIKPDVLSKQEAYNVFYAVSERQEYKNTALSFLSEYGVNITDIHGEETLLKFILTIGGQLSSSEQYEKIKNIKLPEVVHEDILIAINKTLSHIDSSITWLQKYAASINSYFDEGKKTSTKRTTESTTGFSSSSTVTQETTEQQPETTTHKSLSSRISYSFSIIMIALILLFKF